MVNGADREAVSVSADSEKPCVLFWGKDKSSPTVISFLQPKRIAKSTASVDTEPPVENKV